MVTMLIAQSVDPRSTSNVLFQRSDQGESRLAAPDRVVSMLNRRMIELNLELVYFTCCYGILDESSGELEFVRAGHTLPLLATSSGAVTVLDDEGDAPVGLFPDVEYHAIRRRLEVGDRLVLYTDGITECTDRDGGEYGVDRLAETLRANAGTRLSDLPASLASSARAWSGKEELADDMTLLVVELSQSAGENPAKPEGDAS
jgi:sigma-B regulation protein RsbU (phosphoserine phosphatase)